MITIYCLVNPFDNKPFYVGATNSKLNDRLSGHIHDAKTWVKYPPFMPNEKIFKKHYLIVDIISNNKKPRIRELLQVHARAANHYEEFFYRMFIKQGYEMYQAYYAFKYYEARTNSRFYKPNNHYLMKHNDNVDNLFKNKWKIIW